MIRRIFPAIALALATCGGPPAFAQATTPAYSVDLSGVLTSLLQLAGIVLVALVGIATKNVLAWLVAHKQLTQAQADALSTVALDAASAKSVAAAIGATKGIITAHGWDHPEVKSAVVATAANYLSSHFPDALHNIGLDPSDPATAARIQDMLNRAYPAVVAQEAASPATPDAGITVAALAASAAVPVAVTAANGVAPAPALVPVSSIVQPPPVA